MKKLLALLLAAIMVMGLVACAPAPSGNPSTPAKDPNGSSSVVEDNSIKFPLENEVTFKVVAHQADDMYVDEGLSNNKLWKEIYEKTNVKIEFNWITAADKAGRLSQLNNMLNAGTAGDAILCAFMDDASLSDLVATNQLMAITEYVNDKTLMPNLHKNVFDIQPGVRGTWTFPDGEIYVLGSFGGQQAVAVDAEFYINKTWLDKAQMEVPTTWEQFDAALKYFADHDMNGNGNMDDEIPLFVHTTQNYSLPSHYMAMWGISGKDNTTDSYCYIMDDGETVDYIPLTGNYKAMLKQFKKWNDEGVLFNGWDLDKSAVNEFYRGTGDSVIGVMTYAGKPKRNPDEYVMFCPPAAPGYELEVYNFPGYVYGSKNNFTILKDCENPEILLAWLDTFYDETVAVRNKYGEVGTAYVYQDENGKIGANVVDPDWFEAHKKTENNLGTLLQSLPHAYTQNVYDNVLVPSVSERYREITDMYGEFINPTPWPRPYFGADDSTTVSEVKADVFGKTGQWYAEFVTGKKDIDKDWDAYLAEMNQAEVDRFLEAHQNAYDNWLEGAKG